MATTDVLWALVRDLNAATRNKEAVMNFVEEETDLLKFVTALEKDVFDSGPELLPAANQQEALVRVHRTETTLASQLAALHSAVTMLESSEEEQQEREMQCREDPTIYQLEEAIVRERENVARWVKEKGEYQQKLAVLADRRAAADAFALAHPQQKYFRTESELNAEIARLEQLCLTLTRLVEIPRY